MDGWIYEGHKGDGGITCCWTVVMDQIWGITALPVTVTMHHYSCCLLTFPVVQSTFTLWAFDRYVGSCRCFFLKPCDIQAATNRPHRKADRPGIHVTASALLTCKTSEGKEFSHMLCHEGHVSRTLLLFREMPVGRAPTAEVSSAGMTRHTPTSKTQQGGH